MSYGEEGRWWGEDEGGGRVGFFRVRVCASRGECPKGVEKREGGVKKIKAGGGRGLEEEGGKSFYAARVMGSTPLRSP